MEKKEAVKQSNDSSGYLNRVASSINKRRAAFLITELQKEKIVNIRSSDDREKAIVLKFLIPMLSKSLKPILKLLEQSAEW